MSELPKYSYERIFNAPLSKVWRLWTEPDLLSRWYGPGIETIIHKFELKPGGEWRNEMSWGDKKDLSKMTFKEVINEEKIVWHHSSVDSDWNVISNPMMPDWPRILLTTVTFEEDGENTKVTLTQVPIDAAQNEIDCFANMMAGMDNGWGSGFNIIEEMLAE